MAKAKREAQKLLKFEKKGKGQWVQDDLTNDSGALSSEMSQYCPSNYQYHSIHPVPQISECTDYLRKVENISRKFENSGELEKIYKPGDGRETAVSNSVREFEDQSVPKPAQKVTAPRRPGIPKDSSNTLAGSTSKGALSNDEPGEQLRPGYSKAGMGKQITLHTNYFDLVPQADLLIHRYTVTILQQLNPAIAEKPDPAIVDRPDSAKKDQSDPKQKQKLSDLEPEKHVAEFSEAGKLPDLPKDQKAQMRKRRRLFEILLEDKAFKEAGLHVATDYASILLSSKELHLEKDTIDVIYRDEGQEKPDLGIWATRLALKKEISLNVQKLVEYLRKPSKTQSDVFKEGCLQALNIIVKQTANSNPGVFASAQNSKFYPIIGESVELAKCLVALKGYQTSVRTSISRLLVNVHACTSAFYQEAPVNKIMEVLGQVPAEDFLKKCRIRTKYTGSYKYRTIRGYARDPKTKEICTAAGFEIERSDKGHEGEKISIAGYFKSKYDINLEGRNYPLLDLGVIKLRDTDATSELGAQKRNLSQSADRTQSDKGHDAHGPNNQIQEDQDHTTPSTKRPPTKDRIIMVPPELCYLVPGQSFLTKLGDDETEKMKKFAARPPGENARRIEYAAKDILELSGDNLCLRHFGLDISPRLVCVQGRRLDHPSIEYRSKTSKSPGRDVRVVQQPKEGSWNLIDAHLVTTKSDVCFSVLRIFQSRCSEEAYGVKATHIEAFKKNFIACGFASVQLNGPEAGYRIDIPDSSDLAGIDDRLFKGLKVAQEPRIDFVLVLLPKKDTYLYGRIKFLADTKLGLHTVCTVPDKFIKGKRLKEGGKQLMDPMYVANVAMKVNLKLDGQNHALPAKNLTPLSTATTMIVGIDVNHPSHTVLQNPQSIAGVVANTGPSNLSQWPCSLRTQAGGTEMVEDLEEMISEHLDNWVNANKDYPKRLLVYRDGVSESQYAQIRNIELPKIRQACRSKGRSPQITIIVAAKRHQTRFYPTKAEYSDLSYKNKDPQGNPPPGTVVDRGITMEKGWDFYLQPHYCIQGTAKPAHYVVVHNEFDNLTADAVEVLTHNLCYTFGRATKAVSLCPPIYYAHLACERGKFYLHKYYQHPEAKEFAHSSKPPRASGKNIAPSEPTWDVNVSPWTRTRRVANEELNIAKDGLAGTMFYI